MTDYKIAPSTRLTQIAKQLSLIYDSDPWYGCSITHVLNAMDTLDAFDAPAENVHSVAELVSHMIAWRAFALRRLQGDNKFLPHQENSFNRERYADNKTDAWHMLIHRLKENQRQLLALLQKKDETILEQKVTGKPYNFEYLLNGIIQHDLYHLGQIAYIQKIQQNTDHHPKDSDDYFDVFSYESLSFQK